MKSDRYWARRGLELERLMQDKTDATIKQVNRLYSNALTSIDEQIAKTFVSYVKSGTLSRQEAMLLLSRQQTREARAQLLRLLSQTTDPVLRKELISKLDAPAYAYRISRLEALKDSVYFQARQIGLQEVRMVTDRLHDVLEQSYYLQSFQIQQGTGYGFRPELLTDHRIKAMLAHDWTKGGNYSQRIWGNNRAFAYKVRGIIETGVLSGQGMATMRKSLLAAAGMDDTKGARYVCNRLIRTEVNYFAVQGQMLGYQEAGIEKYRFLATLDLRTSEQCRVLDLKVFPVAEAKAGENLPPMHPHCRSTTAPYLAERDYSRLKRRARDPETGKTYLVPADMTYRQWYAQYVTPEKEAAFRQKKQAEKAKLTNAIGHPIMRVAQSAVHLDGEPNSITQTENRKGGINRNYYGKDGKQTKQISNNSHNHKAVESYGTHGEHAHDYLYDENGKLKGRPYRELTDQERKENNDIL